MKTLYLDCGMGAAGDMLTAALLELLPDPEGFVERLNRLGIPGVRFQKTACSKCGITGARMDVEINGLREEDCHDHHHGHTDMADVAQIVGDLALPESVREDVLTVYRHIAQAESHVHGMPVEEIHFHEVGAMDAIADVTAVCLLMHILAPEEVVVSPVHVGCGHVRCAHGELPIPAPATAYLLRDVPIYGGSVTGELCTPTGAALLRHFATRFGDMPPMRVQVIGYGMGKKDFPVANCLRAMLGQTGEGTDTVLELSCNVDDMTAEELGFAVDRLLEDGALDVYTVAVGMKKSRPGTLLRVLCRPQERENMLRLLFLHTTTLGVREAEMRRYVLDRKIETVNTPYGPVRCKTASGYGVERRKYEYDDLARIAKERGISLSQARALLEKCAGDCANGE